MSLQQQTARIARYLLLVMAMSVLAACSLVPATEEEPLFTGAPEVRISAPIAGDTYREGVGVNILVRVENAGADIGRIAVEVDGEIVGEALQPNNSDAASFTIRNGWIASGGGEHTIRAIVTRLDGETTGEDSVSINVLRTSVIPESAPEESPEDAQPPTIDNPLPTPTLQPQPTATEAMAESSESDDAAATDEQAGSAENASTDMAEADNVPMVRVSISANIRSGPSPAFDPPIGNLAADATAEILALNTAETWYKIVYNGGEGWISSQVVEVIGDVSDLPREADPPLPQAAESSEETGEETTDDTSSQTQPVSTEPDLRITNLVINPNPFVCNSASEIRATVTNAGGTPSTPTTLIVEDIFNGAVSTSTTAQIPALSSNQSFGAILFLTVNTNVGQQHITRTTIDPDNTVAESDETNNARESTYVLTAGGC